jgi:GTP-binding protein HflX
VGGRASGGVGIGGRGPGETKIETDRRRINTRISKLKQHLRRLDAQRALKRAERQRNLVPSVAIVGYTNAGKSSLLNRLTDAGVLVDDALFATLDPTTRRLKTSDGRTYTLTDTVGFVRHLPHELVEAFASTLEEVAQADLLVHVVDGTERDPLGQVAAVRTVLENIGAADLPEILVINKIDKVSAETLVNLRHSLPTALFISARNGTGLIALKMAIEATLPTPDVEVDVVVPWHRGDLVDKVHRSGNLIESAHVVAGTRVHARVNPALAAELAAL